MARTRTTTRAGSRIGRTRRPRIPRLWPGPRWRRRLLGTWRALPRQLRFVIGGAVAVALWVSANWVYHVFHKPTELLFPVSRALAKTPTETWREYGEHFRRHATPVISPEFLAALAQIESAGNPLAQTYWKWDLTWHPLRLYRPASSAVGMYQITDGTFTQAEPACRGQNATGGGEPARGPGLCWFDSLYSRLLPSQAIELTAGLLDREVTAILRRRGIARATPQQKQNLAAVIHLCGAGAGEAYARRGFRLAGGQRCGDQEVGAYLARVNQMTRVFAGLAKDA